MAVSYTGIHVLSGERVTVSPGRFASFSPGWQSLIPAGKDGELLSRPGDSAKEARRLSKLLSKTVLWFFLYDEEVVEFTLFSEGKTAAARDASSDKNISKVPGIIGLEEGYRKRLYDILSVTDAEYQTELLEEFFGVKLLLLPEMMEDPPETLARKRDDALFRQYRAENDVPSGKKSPVQARLLFEMDGVLSNSDWGHKYFTETGILGVFRKHYWLYAKEQHTGSEEVPVCFRDGRLVFLSDEEMLAEGADRLHNDDRMQKDPRFEQLFFPDRVRFFEDAPPPYPGRTIKNARGFYGLGFDAKGRFLAYDENSCFALVDEGGKMLAKQHVKGQIIDQDGDYLLTWARKTDLELIDGVRRLTRFYGVIRGYQIYDK